MEFSIALQNALNGLNEAGNRERLQKLKESFALWVKEAVSELEIDKVFEVRDAKKEEKEKERYVFTMGIDRLHKRAIKMKVVNEERLLRWRLMRLSKTMNSLQRSCAASSLLSDFIGKKQGSYLQLAFRKIWREGHDPGLSRAALKLQGLLTRFKASAFMRIALRRPKNNARQNGVGEFNPEENDGIFEFYGDASLQEERDNNKSLSVVSESDKKEPEPQREKSLKAGFDARTKPNESNTSAFGARNKSTGKEEKETVAEGSKFWNIRNIISCTVYATVPVIIAGVYHGCTK